MDVAILMTAHDRREETLSCLMDCHREADAMKAIATSDKERGNHYFRYTDRKWGKAQNYDLSINSSLLGIDGTVEMLADIAGIEDRIL